MNALEEALKNERDELEEQRLYLRKYLTEAQERFQDVENRLWLVFGLIGQNKVQG